MIRMNGCGNAGMRGWEELIEKLCAFVALCENQGSGVRGRWAEDWGMNRMIGMDGRTENIIFETRSCVRYESRSVGW